MSKLEKVMSEPSGHTATLRPRLAKCGTESAAFRDEVVREFRELMAELGGAGWGLENIAAALGCSSKSLGKYRKGEDKPRAETLKALHALVKREVRRVG